MAKYKELLKDPRWQKKRLKIMERDNFTCQMCGATYNTLAIHHKYYEKGLNPWEYPNESLITVCEDCHESETFIYHNMDCFNCYHSFPNHCCCREDVDVFNRDHPCKDWYPRDYARLN